MSGVLSSKGTAAPLATGDNWQQCLLREADNMSLMLECWHVDQITAHSSYYRTHKQWYDAAMRSPSSASTNLRLDTTFMAADIPAASADNLNVWEEYQKAVEQQIGTYLPEEELQQFEQQQQPEGSDTIAADPVAVYEAIEQQQPEDSNIDMVAADEQHVDDAFQLIDTQPGPTQPDQQQQQPSDQAAQQVDQQQAFEQQQQLLQPELVDQVELDSTVADVLASNPQVGN